MARKTVPKAQSDQDVTPEQRLLMAIFGDQPTAEPEGTIEDEALARALDAISERIESRSPSWAETLDWVEDQLLGLEQQSPKTAEAVS